VARRYRTPDPGLKPIVIPGVVDVAGEVISDFIHVGDRVAVRLILRGVGHSPGVAQEMTALFTVRKGKSLALEAFWDHAEALGFLGLEE